MKKIALLNDLSGFGKCSLTAAIPVVSAMGIQAVPLPTAILSAQTGFDHYYYDDYTDRMNGITDSWDKMEVSFDGICSGYLGNAQQIKNVTYFLDRFQNDHNIFLADPVMGDNGKRIKIFTNDLLDTMKDLTKRADIITPNLTEACLLADVSYEDMMVHQKKEDFCDRIFDLAATIRRRATCNQTVIITGVLRYVNQQPMIGNLVLTEQEQAYFESPYNGMSFSGTGDLFASVVVGARIKGMSAQSAVKLAMDFLKPAIDEASMQKVPRNHGVMFEKYLSILMEANK